jgi:quinol monooxygenase YgiN
MITILLRFAIAQDRDRDLRAFLARARPYYEQPGGIRVRLLQSVDTPGEYVELVEYRDRATYLADQERVASDPGMKALLEEWRALHVGALRVEVLEEADSGA